MPMLEQLDYRIRADKTINTGLIEQQWDNILRFVVSLKLHYALPSSLLKRLDYFSTSLSANHLFFYTLIPSHQFGRKKRASRRC